MESSCIGWARLMLMADVSIEHYLLFLAFFLYELTFNFPFLLDPFHWHDLDNECDDCYFTANSIHHSFYLASRSMVLTTQL